MNVVDSSGWLEYLSNGPNANFFAEPILNPSQLLVPTISFYEVFKRLLVTWGVDQANEAALVMKQGVVIDLDISLALSAAQLSANLKLPMADSIILASARAHKATLWTQDADFKNLPNVQYVEKQAP